MTRRFASVMSLAVFVAGGAAGSSPCVFAADHGPKTPIRYVVIVFQENVSFDHYFATYPHAANPPGEPPFFAARGTPTLNGLDEALQAPNNPNAVQPFRLEDRKSVV